MINRWTWFAICVVFGLVLLLCGWLMPAHLRAIEPSVLKQAGRDTATLTGHGLELAQAGQLGPAEMLSSAAQMEKLRSADELAAAVQGAAKQYPIEEAWGVADPALDNYFPSAPAPTELGFSDFVVREDNRNKALGFLQNSQQPGVRELLQTRTLSNLSTFAPSHTAGGEAFDAAVVIAGVLLNQQKLTTGLSSDIYSAALAANQGNPGQLEQVLLDFLSLGQRFNWGQLVSFIGKTDSAATLHEQADLARAAGKQLPILFAATELSGDPKAVAQYAETFHDSGLKDIAAALPFGAGGVGELVRQNQRLYTSHWRQWAAEYDPFAAVLSLMADYCWRTPLVALIMKWVLYLGAGFLLALALHFGRPPASNLEEPLQVRGFHVAREILFASGFLLVVLLLSEPFLVGESTTAAMPFRLRIPTVGSAVQPGAADIKASIMNQSNPIIIALFFVLQGLLYSACLVKLAEIRRQQVGARVKLKLLENEEHLFDAGLYLGFLGTIVSFIIYSVVQGKGHQFSLMVAYSSTSFGILFVSFFKIFHLRPTKRRLLLEAEAESAAMMYATPDPASYVQS
jgi:hypothetical protein